MYQRLPGSKLYFGIFQVFFWTGIAGISVGTYNMIMVCIFTKMMNNDLLTRVVGQEAVNASLAPLNAGMGSPVASIS